MDFNLSFARGYAGPGQVALALNMPAKLSRGQTIEVTLNVAEEAHFRRDPCYTLSALAFEPKATVTSRITTKSKKDKSKEKI